MSSTVAPPKPLASHLQLPLPHRHPPTASVVLGRANGRARAVERRRRRPPAASTPGLPRERALGIDPLDRSGRDKRQRVSLEGDRMAIPIGFYIGARPEPAVVHPLFRRRFANATTSRLPSYDSTCSLSKLTFLLDSIIVNPTPTVLLSSFDMIWCGELSLPGMLSDQQQNVCPSPSSGT
ncbi:hypothetical protein THAOC_30000, partial [Thalassiosira oceanica]